MEIIVICNETNSKEGRFIKKFCNSSTKVKLIEVKKRETLYQSWNRGIHSAKGMYITNANTDDRHEANCLEILVNHLDRNPDIDLAYGRHFKSTIPNECYAENDKSFPCTSQMFFPGSLLLHDYIGAQPVWRKSIHDKIGLFDENYEVVGDYEFVLRAVSSGCKFSYVPEAQGLMLWHKNALSTKDSRGYSEKQKLFDQCRTTENITRIYKYSCSDNQNIEEKAHLDLGIRALCFYPQFNSGNPSFDFSFAQECFSRNADHISQLNVKTLRKILNFNSIVQGNDNENLFFYSYPEKLPSEYELKGVEPLYVEKTGMENIQGKVFQKYSFNISRFYQFFFGHLNIKSLSNANCVYIWGYNERGNILAKYLESSGIKNLKFIDSNPQIFTKTLQSTEKLPSSFEDVKDTENVVFILTMSSHHWSTVKTEIEKKLPGSRVLTFDKD